MFAKYEEKKGQIRAVRMMILHFQPLDGVRLMVSTSFPSQVEAIIC